MLQVDKYRLLAFIVWAKKLHPCGVIKGSINEVSNRLGINYVTTRKRLREGIRLGLIEEIKPNVYKFGSLKKSCNQLLPADLSNKHIRFFNISQNNKSRYSGKYRYRSVKDIYIKIKKEIVLLNFKQQQFNLSRMADVIKALKSSSRNRKDQALIKKALKKNSVEEILAMEDRLYIKSGVYHLKKITGMTHTSNQRILKELIADRIIERSIVKKRLAKRVNTYADHAIFDRLKITNSLIFTSSNHFYTILGSRITLLNAIDG